jgi:hypothetical protein
MSKIFKQLINAFFTKRYQLVILIAFAVVAMAVAYFLIYPKTTLTVGVSSYAVGSDGQLTWQYKLIQNHLEKHGVELKYVVQSDKAAEKPTLEFMVENKAIDFVIHENTGAQLPLSVRNNYRSLGSVSRTPLYFYRKVDGPKINKLEHLHGRTIAYWTSPEGKQKPAFSENGVKPSPYSSDWIIHQLLAHAGIITYSDAPIVLSPALQGLKGFRMMFTAQILNPWPSPITPELPWDVAISSQISSQKGLSLNFLKPVLGPVKGEIELLNKNIELFQIDDIESFTRANPHLELFRIAESTFSRFYNLPKRDIWVPAYFRSIAVKKDLDPGLVMLLAEAMQGIYFRNTPTSRTNEFPSFAQPQMFDPHPVAERFYKDGRPFLANYVSPALATLIIKILLVLVPLLTILWPITNLLPKIYSFYVKHKITHWYVDLEMIDKSLGSADEKTRKIFAEIIEDISQGITKMRLPILHSHYVQELFAARAHVNLIRAKLNELKKSNSEKFDA